MSTYAEFSATNRSAQAGVVVGTSACALVLGALVVYDARVAVSVVACSATAVMVWCRPASAALLLVALTPLVAGIDRGRVVPLLRPNEALAVFLCAVLLTRTALRAPPGLRLRVRLNSVEMFFVAMAVANSVLPIVVMLARGRSVESDDITYAMVLWKYLVIYGLVRLTVRTDREVQACLWTALLSATFVALIGVMQALDLLGIRAALAGYYAPFGYTGALALPRGGSTLSLPAAAADLYLMNLIVAAGLWWKDRRHPVVLGALSAVCVIGTFAAAEFSAVIGLLVVMATMAWSLRRLDLLRLAPPAVLLGAAATWPVIEHRLAGFEGVAGIPVSWTTRWYNLTTYFWPELLQGSNPVWGVRPSARVAVSSQGTGYVWIESGYTWLLWGGGVPLFIAYCGFVLVSIRAMTARCRPLDSYASIAALAGLSASVMVVVLMNFDPHLTYRGSADYLFTLLALAFIRQPGPRPGAQMRVEDEDPLEAPKQVPLLINRGGVGS